ncbi:hypothetical protein NC651_037421 [Populus alba x Populus x berolinensis]|nr:hypothetical protein NC651_037421 [Populus alba x Populus x berolinensis]
MHPLTTTSSFLLTLFLSLHLTTSIPSNGISNLTNCNQNFSCGNLTNVTYPFTGGLRPSNCGPPEFGLTCENESVTILKANSLSYRVTILDQTSQTLRLSRSDLDDDSPCTRQFTNVTLDDRIFSLGSSHGLYLFYGCKKINDSVMGSDQPPKTSRFSCDNDGVPEEGFFSILYPYGTEYSFPYTFECQTNIQVPILETQAQQLLDNGSLVGEVLKEGFDVSYSNPYSVNCTECYKKHPGGYCGFDTQLGKPICICNDKLCPGFSRSGRRLLIAVGTSAAAAAILTLTVRERPHFRMNSSAFSFLSDFVLVLLLFIHVPSSSSNDDLFTACSKKFVCGNISAGFPFWGNDRSPACGIPELELRCESNIPKMKINQVAYRVLGINQDDGTLRIAREDSFVGLYCPPQFINSTFNPKVFESVEGSKNLTFIYGCKDAPTTIPGRIPFTCKINEVNDQSGYIQVGDTGPGECYASVFVPVSVTDWQPFGNMLEEHLKKGFEVRWKVDRECWECKTSSGVCGIDYATNQTTCYCPNQSRGSRTCAPPGFTPTPAPALPSQESSWSRGRLHIVVENFKKLNINLLLFINKFPVVLPVKNWCLCMEHRGKPVTAGGRMVGNGRLLIFLLRKLQRALGYQTGHEMNMGCSRFYSTSSLTTMELLTLEQVTQRIW